MSDPSLRETDRRRHPLRRREPDARAAKVEALRAARQRGDWVIDPDRIARRMLG